MKYLKSCKSHDKMFKILQISGNVQNLANVKESSDLGKAKESLSILDIAINRLPQ